jgi:hypothetical protein
MMTEQEYLDYMARQGFALDPTLTVRHVPLSVDPASTEAAFQARLQQFAKAAGYLYYHTYSAKKSDPGWVDTALVHPQGNTLFLMELKSRDGEVGPAQRRWLEALARVTRIDTGVYRPADWPRMVEKLRGDGCAR